MWSKHSTSCVCISGGWAKHCGHAAACIGTAQQRADWQAPDVVVAGVRKVDLVLHLMAQPPWDARMVLSANKSFYILHYTYGSDFTLDGKYTPGKGEGAHTGTHSMTEVCSYLASSSCGVLHSLLGHRSCTVYRQPAVSWQLT